MEWWYSQGMSSVQLSFFDGLKLLEQFALSSANVADTLGLSQNKLLCFIILAMKYLQIAFFLHVVHIVPIINGKKMC